MYIEGFVSFILEEMKECVQSNNFVVKSTVKNDDFMAEYFITREVQRNVLLALTTRDFFNFSESRNFPGRYVHEFCPTHSLTKFDGTVKDVEIYIKFEVEREDETDVQTVVISFHPPDGRHINYPFRGVS